MVILIILNTILVALLIFFVLYIFRNKNNESKSKCKNTKSCDDIEINKRKQNDVINSDSGRVFDGRFITDEEYQEMMKNRRSDISILLEEVKHEYEYLKELNK